MVTPIQIAILGAATGTLGLLLGATAHVRVGRLRRRTPPTSPTQPQDTRPSGNPRGELDPRAIRNVAMVRYDAFQDMGGRLSFSLALLDSTGDGIVLSSINAHSETRTYAKVIQRGESTHDLSPEETQALEHARRGTHAAEYDAGQSVNAHPRRPQPTS